jgi:rhamnose utilization protein RhaD (predicted bifunctional aldolase and dehydrogenase)
MKACLDSPRSAKPSLRRMARISPRASRIAPIGRLKPLRPFLTLRRPFANTAFLRRGVALDLRCNDSIDALLGLPRVEDVTRRGTITPDHVIRLKPWPLIGATTFAALDWRRQIEDFAKAYSDYFERHAPYATEPKTMLDPLPRGALVRGLGVIGIGLKEKDAMICADLLEQAARVVVAAEKLGHFAPINERQLFEMEYWSLEQAKLKNV